MRPTERAAPSPNSPDVRAEAARRRARELQERRAKLEAGQPSSAETVERARLRAEQSRQRAIEAHRAVAARRLKASAAHRRAAATHEQAAMLAGDGSGDAHQDAAEAHRSAATDHEAAALEMTVVDERAAAEVDDRDGNPA